MCFRNYTGLFQKIHKTMKNKSVRCECRANSGVCDLIVKSSQGNLCTERMCRLRCDWWLRQRKHTGHVVLPWCTARCLEHEQCELNERSQTLHSNLSSLHRTSPTGGSSPVSSSTACPASKTPQTALEIYSLQAETKVQHPQTRNKLVLNKDFNFKYLKMFTSFVSST